MTQDELRDVLHGWLQDTATTGGEWDDTQLNRYLNLGIRDAQKAVIAVDPELVKATYKADIVLPTVGIDPLYSYPVGTWAVIEIATSLDGVTYGKLERVTLRAARSGQASGFVPWDAQHFMLTPPPSTAVTKGLRTIVVPTLVMAVGTDANPLGELFDTLVLKCAERFALRDRGEPTDKLSAEIQQEKQEIPRFYLTQDEPSFVEPSIVRDWA